MVRMDSLNRCADRGDGGAGDVLVLLPVAAADANPADAFAFDEYGVSAFHRCPPVRAGGQAQPDRVQGIQILPLGALGRRRPAVGTHSGSSRRQV